MEEQTQIKSEYKSNVYFGSNDEGRERVQFINSQAKVLGLSNGKGEPSISGYIVHLIDQERKRKERRK